MLSESGFAVLAGFGGGVVLGLAARFGRFCTLSAIEDAIFGRDYRRLGLWALAIAAAGITAAGASWAFGAPTAESIYLSFAPAVAASVVGGLLFGLGMALTGACGYGALARLGGGDLRYLVVFLVMGVSAYAAMSGLLAPIRLALGGPSPATPEAVGMAHWAAARLGLPWEVLAMGVFLAAAVGLLSFRGIRLRIGLALWAVAVGVAVGSGFLLTGWLAAEAFEPIAVETHTFTAPLGETVLYAMTAASVAADFGVGSVVGVVAGAAVGALARREFRWEACDDSRELKRLLLGAALMGLGGVLAMGCTVGQGIAAASLLTVSGPLTLACIFVGAWLGLTWMVRGEAVGPVLELLGIRRG